MTYLERLDLWLAGHRAELELAGTIHYGHSDTDRPNPSANLLVTTAAGGEVELLLWSSGEAELSSGPFDASRFDHFDLTSDAELATLLERFMSLVRAD